MTKRAAKNNIPEKYHGAVKVAMIAAAAAGPLGILPDGVLDIAAIGTIWGTLICGMTSISGVKLDKATAVKIASSVLIGAGGYYAGCKVASKLFNLIPGAGQIIGAGVSCWANILFTYQFAWALAQMLEKEEITTFTVVVMGAKIIKRMATGGFSLHTIKDILRIYKHKSHPKEQAVETAV